MICIKTSKIIPDAMCYREAILKELPIAKKWDVTNIPDLMETEIKTYQAECFVRITDSNRERMYVVAGDDGSQIIIDMARSAVEERDRANYERSCLRDEMSNLYHKMKKLRYRLKVLFTGRT